MIRDLLAFLLGWSAGWWLLWRIPVPPTGVGVAGTRPPLSIVVPARDEQAVLPTLLSSLGPELRPGDEVIVVDDHSRDTTADQARAVGATVISSPPLPDGWLGKPWACHTGAAAAANRLLAFLDADTRILAGGLDRLVAGHAAAGGLYSVQPWHVVPRPHERLAAVFNVVAMMGTAAFTPGTPGTRRFLGRRRPPPTGAFGPCLVTTAADYRSAGGHASVPDAVLDDLALAARFRSAGLPVAIRGGRGTIGFRMYPAGTGQLVEGFTKNFAAAAGEVRVPILVLVSAWIAALTAPLALVTGAPGLAAICYVAAAVQLHVHLRRIGSFGAITAALYVVPLACFLAVFIRSVVLTFVRRRVSWKGRTVPTRSRP
ncbi:MAG: glycosyltransferase [Acidimicrobiales bacterium]